MNTDAEEHVSRSASAIVCRSPTDDSIVLFSLVAVSLLLGSAFFILMRLLFSDANPLLSLCHTLYSLSIDEFFSLPASCFGSDRILSDFMTHKIVKSKRIVAAAYGINCF